MHLGQQLTGLLFIGHLILVLSVVWWPSIGPLCIRVCWVSVCCGMPPIGLI